MIALWNAMRANGLTDRLRAGRPPLLVIKGGREAAENDTIFFRIRNWKSALRFP